MKLGRFLTDLFAWMGMFDVAAVVSIFDSSGMYYF